MDHTSTADTSYVSIFDFELWTDITFLFVLLFLRLSLDVMDFVKAGYHMRRAWKMYEKCYREIHGSPSTERSKNKKKKVQ